MIFMKKNLLNLIIKEREIIITLCVALFCLLSFSLFPVKDMAQNATAMVVFLFLIPFLYQKIILKKELADFGLQIGNWKKGLLFSAISLVAFLSLFLLLFYKTSFTNYYVLSAGIRSSFFLFIFYEFFQAIFMLFLFEFFFRGFLMLNFTKRFRLWSILLQFMAFLFLLFIFKNLGLHFLLIAFSALFSGFITYYSRSIWYSFATTFIFILLCDAFMIKFIIQ